MPKQETQNPPEKLGRPEIERRVWAAVPEEVKTQKDTPTHGIYRPNPYVELKLTFQVGSSSHSGVWLMARVADPDRVERGDTLREGRKRRRVKLANYGDMKLFPNTRFARPINYVMRDGALDHVMIWVADMHKHCVEARAAFNKIKDEATKVQGDLIERLTSLLPTAEITTRDTYRDIPRPVAKVQLPNGIKFEVLREEGKQYVRMYNDAPLDNVVEFARFFDPSV